MSLQELGPQHVGVYDYTPHPAVELAVQRHLQTFESPQAPYDDASKLVLAVEGGGYSGYVASGGLVVMEQARLIASAVDQAIGTSSGALSAASIAAQQGTLGASNYADMLYTNFANPWRILGGRKPLNYDWVFRDTIRDKKPYDPLKLAEGPDFGAVAVNLDTREAELLKDFDDVPDLMLATRASCAIPILSGPPIQYKGKTMSDGGLLEAVPFRAALSDGPPGATYVLALRTSGEDYRKEADSWLQVQFSRRHWFGGVALAELIKDRARIYNEDAETLQAGDVYPTVTQIALRGAERPVQRLEKSMRQLKYGFELGAAAMGKAFGMPKLFVKWDRQDVPTIFTDNTNPAR